MTFSFFGKRYFLNVAKFKSFLAGAVLFVFGASIILWIEWTFLKAVFLGGM